MCSRQLDKCLKMCIHSSDGSLSLQLIIVGDEQAEDYSSFRFSVVMASDGKEAAFKWLNQPFYTVTIESATSRRALNSWSARKASGR